MSKITKSDHYFGTVLSALVRNKIVPALIENTDDRQILECTTDSSEFVMLIKYRAKKSISRSDCSSWNFSLSNDIEKIKVYRDSNKKFVLALVCSSENFNESQLAFLDCKQIDELISMGKMSFTISHQKGKRYYSIKTNKNPILVKYNSTSYLC